MKELLILTGVALATIYLAKRMTAMMPKQTQKRIDTKGREIMFSMNQNGFLVDEYGGNWA